MDKRLLAIIGALILYCPIVQVHGDDSLPPDTVQRLKDATVYVKTEIGPLKMTGTGFVIDVTGNTALIATNQHVIAKPKELKQGSYIPGLRGRDRLALTRLQQALASSQPSISIVFNSGNSNEQVIKAELMGELEEPDLAILKVSEIKTPPTAFTFREPAPPYETMGLFVLGFPFGDALSTNKGNPTITIGKGSISSIRKDENGKLTKLQIDGALNPGNSGGPVVDAKGNLVGIAVQTIQGSNIGLAIPPSELSSVLDGTVGKPSVIVGKTEKGSAPEYEVIVPMIDPMKRLKSVSLYFVDGAAAIDSRKKGQSQLESISESRRVDLAINDHDAKATLPLTATPDQNSRDVTIQVEFVNRDGKTVYLDPVVVKVAAPQILTTSVAKDGNTTTMTQTTQTPNGGMSRRTVTITRGGAPKSKMSEAKDDADNDSDDDSEKMESDKVAKKTTKTKDSDKSKTSYKPKSDEVENEPDDKEAKKTTEVAWTNTISKMKKIPDDEVTGKIDGQEFTLDKATLNNLGLTLEMGPGFRGVFSKAKLDIRLFVKPNEDVSGRKIVVNGTFRHGDPIIFASSMRKGDKIPQTHTHNEYMMVLEFGEYNAEDRVQPGKIYVCLPDRGKSFLAGSFEASAK